MPLLLLVALFSSCSPTRSMVQPTASGHSLEDPGITIAIPIEVIVPGDTVTYTEFIPADSTATGQPPCRFEDRAITYLPPMGNIQPKQAGKITVTVCLRKDGTVDVAEIDSENTTITDSKLLEYFVTRARKYKFASSDIAPELQCGFLDYKIERVSGKQ
ncbi:MAG: hypothetical protein ACK4TA_04585 [Saprospiraceae bacterium]